MSGIFNPLQDNNQLTIDYATYELSLVLASGSPLVLESGGFNINLGTGIINNSGALEFDTTIGYNFSNPLSINGLAMQVPYSLGNLNSGTAQWVHLGTLTIGQGGYSAYFKIVFNAGYNANINQNIELFIRFKTSNNNSVNSYGFAADSSFYTTGLNTSIASGDVIFVGNAAGISATAYDLYIYFPIYTGKGSYYTVETTGSWVNNLLVESPSGTANSSTVLLPNFQHNITSPLFTAHNTLDNGSGLATLTTLNLVNVLDAQYINISNTLINNGGALEVNIDNTYIIENSGVLSINLTENYTWTGQHQFNNTTDYTIILAAELGNIYGALTLPGSAAFSLLNNLVFDAGVGTGGYNPLGWDAISNFAHNYRVYASYGAGSTYTFNNGGANVANIIGGGLSYNVEGSTASTPSPHRVGFNVNAGATGGSTGLGVLVSNAALTLGSTYDLSGGSAIDTLLGFGLFGSSSGYCSGFLDFNAYGGNTAYVYFFVQGTDYGHYINNGELWVIH